MPSMPSVTRRFGAAGLNKPARLANGTFKRLCLDLRPVVRHLCPTLGDDRRQDRRREALVFLGPVRPPVAQSLGIRSVLLIMRLPDSTNSSDIR